LLILSIVFIHILANGTIAVCLCIGGQIEFDWLLRSGVSFLLIPVVVQHSNTCLFRKFFLEDLLLMFCVAMDFKCLRE